MRAASVRLAAEAMLGARDSGIPPLLEDSGMRLFVAAFVLSIASWPIAGAIAADAAPPDPAGSVADSSDAMRHAKRTECLRQAKAKKLVGADKTAFIKNCLAAP
jgi:hypothetical protein